nr:hypothetical protein L195_g044779 [Ipomoea batatas]
MRSNAGVEPELAGGRNVTAETVPLADNIHNALGLCFANANTFAAISCIKVSLDVCGGVLWPEKTRSDMRQGKECCPSGPYFLGLPLFFLTGIDRPWRLAGGSIPCCAPYDNACSRRLLQLGKHELTALPSTLALHSRGLPLARFGPGVLEPGEGKEDMGDNAKDMLAPSGPYFLGLPLFFFTGSPPVAPPPELDPMLMP